MPSPITRSSHSSLPGASHPACDAASSLEQSPQQLRTSSAPGRLSPKLNCLRHSGARLPRRRRMRCLC
ncbi:MULTISPECIES: HopW family type III effector protein [Pseudomonas syringae group]|uniref:HopW family type III effector protein n=1 Tax=Pseudomonas syringae group TaxID=136849 RepID=UPI003F8859F4